jgi:hypothetical protein
MSERAPTNCGKLWYMGVKMVRAHSDIVFCYLEAQGCTDHMDTRLRMELWLLILSLYSSAISKSLNVCLGRKWLNYFTR